LRSLLFIPGDSPGKLEKGLTSGADALIIDLEDSISAERKVEARQTALAFLQQQANSSETRPRLLVRVNGIETGLTDADLDVVMAGKPDAIMLPKAVGGPSVIHLDAKLTAREAIHNIADGATKIIALATETAAALFVTGSFANASPRLIGLTWGAEDLSAELGAETNRGQDGRFLDPYRLARSLCLAGAAAAGVQAIDTVYVDFRNAEGLKRETEDGRRDGFTARMAIHPAQVPIINAVFTPTREAVAHANKVIAAFAAQPGAGVVGIDGKMYDRPHLVRAQQLVARAKAAGVS
jgi:citrate lyase subunit beta/citryl-CoA lyase